MGVDRQTLEHIAELARIAFTAEEMDALATDLEAIVAYIGELDTLDTTDLVEPSEHAQMRASPLREDHIEPGLSHSEALATAPRTPDGGFRVPKFAAS